MNSAQRDINRKLRIFEHAKTTGNVSKTCRYFGISRTAFYEWKKAYKENGEPGLVNQKPCPRNPKLRTPPEVEEKNLYLRRKYHLGQLRISCYLKRYHGISVSSSGVWNVLKRNGMNRLPRNTRKRAERSHSTDEQEFYQLLSYTDDVDLKKKLAVWEDFYNLWRPHSSKNGKTPYEVYEVLSEKMKIAA